MSHKLTKHQLANSIPEFASHCAKPIWEEFTKILISVSPSLKPNNILHLELALIAKDLYNLHLEFPQNKALEIEDLVLDMLPKGKEGYYGLEIQDYEKAIFVSVARNEEAYFGLLARLLHRITDGKYLEYVKTDEFLKSEDQLYECLDFKTTTAATLKSGNVVVDFEAQAPKK